MQPYSVAPWFGTKEAAGLPPIVVCVNISAPDNPIEINLNINVTQEVVYRLDSEAKSLIQQNPNLF